MFCKNCGNKIEDGQVFCTVCGYKIEPSAPKETPAESSNGFSAASDFGDSSSAPVSEAQPAVRTEAAYESVNNTYAQPDNMTYSESAFVGTVAPAPKKPKSKKKKIIFASIASVLVLTIVAGAIWWDDLFGSSPKSEMEKYQSEFVGNLAGSLSETLGVARDIGEVVNAVGNEGEISSDNFLMGMNGAGVEIMIGDTLKEALADEMYMSASDLDWIESAGVNGELVVDNEAVGINYGISLNSTDIISAQCSVDTQNGDVYLTSPELFSKSMKFEEVISQADFEEVNEALEQFTSILEILPDEAVIEQLICSYADCIVSAFDDVEEKTETVKVDGVSQKQTVYVANVNEKTIINIVKAVLKKARNDKELEDVIVNNLAPIMFVPAVSADGDDSIVPAVDEETKKEIIKNMQESIDEILEILEKSDVEKMMGNIDFDIKVYVVDDEAVGFAIAEKNIEFSFRNTQSGSKVATEFVLRTPEGDIGYIGHGTKKNGKVNGEYNIGYNGINIVKITAKDLDTGKMSEGTLDGSIIIGLSDEASAMGGMFGDISDFVDYNIELSGEDGKKGGRVYTLAVNEDEDLFVGLKITTKKDAKAKVNIPKDFEVVNDDNIDEVAQSIVNFDGLFEKLEEAGMPASLVSDLESIVDMSMMPETNYEDYEFDDFSDFESEEFEIPAEIELPDGVEFAMPKVSA